MLSAFFLLACAPSPPPPDQPPRIDAVAAVTLPEEADGTIEVQATDPDGEPPRLWATGLPPGARWDEASGQLRFRPDFTQGGQGWTVTLIADDGTHRVTRPLQITVEDTVAPAAPIVSSERHTAGLSVVALEQPPDDFLGPVIRARRGPAAVVTVPDDPGHRLPVWVRLHGFQGGPAAFRGPDAIGIAPHDPDMTYWWGRQGADGVLRPYTARRVLHLIDWVLDRYPHADPDRVIIEGASMGGAGAATIGLLWARHFAGVRATIGQTIPRNHRPSRAAQLATLWGPPGPGWDDGDLTRALRDDPGARDQFVFTKHGKDDGTIHFGAVVEPSTLTGQSFYEALQAARVGHYAVWDEGGHGRPDPLLGRRWWDSGWAPLERLRRDQSFPAFSALSIDREPGSGGNGRVPRSAEAGHAAYHRVPGDTGWDGDIAGALNRFLRWEAAEVVDTVDEWSVPIRLADGGGGPPPAPGYPTTGDRLGGSPLAVVSVTPRRTQAFRCRPGERIRWDAGMQSGVATADDSGTVTIEGFVVTTRWERLRLRRL